MIHVTPYLLFDGNCAQAMAFYQECFGGTLALTTVADTPMKNQMPPEQHSKIAYAQLKSETIIFSATDWLHPVRKPLQGNTVAMFISGAQYNELKPVFNKLAIGADTNLLDELRDMPFGSYGHLMDKYGVHWFFWAAAHQ